MILFGLYNYNDNDWKISLWEKIPFLELMCELNLQKNIDSHYECTCNIGGMYFLENIIIFMKKLHRIVKKLVGNNTINYNIVVNGKKHPIKESYYS